MKFVNFHCLQVTKLIQRNRSRHSSCKQMSDLNQKSSRDNWCQYLTWQMTHRFKRDSSALQKLQIQKMIKQDISRSQKMRFSTVVNLVFSYGCGRRLMQGSASNYRSRLGRQHLYKSNFVKIIRRSCHINASLQLLLWII